MGHRIVHETARIYIDEQIAKGKTIEEIRKDEVLFQRNVLKRKIIIEKKLSQKTLVFLDRGIPDTCAYDRLHGVKENALLDKAIKNCRYKKVFLLDQLIFKKDYARTETKAQQSKLHKFLLEVYQDLGYEVIKIPVFKTKQKRVDFVLKNL